MSASPRPSLVKAQREQADRSAKLARLAALGPRHVRTVSALLARHAAPSAATATWCVDWLRAHNALARFESDGTVSVTVRGAKTTKRRRATLVFAIFAVEHAIARHR